MLKTELQHYLIRCKILLIIPVYIILKIFTLNITEVYIDTDISLHSDRYADFYEEYSGKITADKLDKISEDKEYSDDKVVYRYLSYAEENPNRRYIVNPSGWEAWLGNIRIDFPLIICLIFIVSYLCSSDNERKMETIKKISFHNDDRIYLSRIFVLLIMFMALSCLSFLLEWSYYGFKYGLSGYSYPVQSLMSYQNSEYTISLWECSLVIWYIKCLGCILVLTFGLIVGSLLKNLWTGMSIIGGIVIIPYVFFNHKLVIEHIVPVGMLIANFYIRGGCENIEFNLSQIAEPCDYFSHNYLFAILSVSIALSYCFYFIAYRIYSKYNLKRSLKIYKYGFAAFIILIPAFIIYSKKFTYDESDFDSRYYTGMIYSDGQYAYDNDGAICGNSFDTTLYRVDIKGKKENIIRDVFETGNCDFLYCNGNYIYYVQKNFDSGEYCFYEVNKENYDTRCLYGELRGDRNYMLDSKYLGIVNVDNADEMSFEESDNSAIYNFWVDGQYIFVTDLNGIEMINIANKHKITIVDDRIGEVIAYEKNKIFYIDRFGEVAGIDVCTGKEEHTGIYNCRVMCLYDGVLYYVGYDGAFMSYQDGEYRQMLDDEVNVRDTSALSVYGEYLYFVTDDNYIFEYDMARGTYNKWLASEDYTVYNTRVYFDNEVYIYRQNGDGYDWVPQNISR